MEEEKVYTHYGYFRKKVDANAFVLLAEAEGVEIRSGPEKVNWSKDWVLTFEGPFDLQWEKLIEAMEEGGGEYERGAIIGEDVGKDVAALAEALSGHSTDWETIGKVKVCKRVGCGREYQSEYRWSTVWTSRDSYGRRIYRFRSGNYCSDACRKALARAKAVKKGPSRAARNKRLDARYKRCPRWRVCGQWLIGMRPDAQFCSPECRNLTWKFRKRKARKRKNGKDKTL